MDKIIAKNTIAQHENNQARIRYLRRSSVGNFAMVFDKVPEFLNINDPEQPGYVDDTDTPYGVKQVEKQWWRLPAERVPADSPALQPAPKPVVESLLLMGSSGSVGQTAGSDLDYWVCYEPESMNERENALFLRKFKLITDWAWGLEVEANFYPINLKVLIRERRRVRPNPINFKKLVKERRTPRLDPLELVKEVAPYLLLEEFYRTYIHVAGRFPLWPVTPTGVTEAEYKKISQKLCSQTNAEYVDIGFPRQPLLQEALGSAFWQAYKSETDIFKGFLKIVLLLEYVESHFVCPALAEDVKKMVLTSDPSVYPVDPYYLTVSKIMDGGAQRLNETQKELLRVAAVIKVIGLGHEPTRPILPDSSKQTVLLQWAQEWGWSQERLEELTSYNNWPKEKQLELEVGILDALASLYTRIAEYLLTNHPDQVDPRQEALAPLAARLLMRLKGLEATIETLFLQQRSRLGQDDLIIKWDEEKQIWVVIQKPVTPFSPEILIYQSRRVLRAGAWLVHNGLYGPTTQLKVSHVPGSPHLTTQFINDITTTMIQTFPPLDYRGMKRDVLWSVGGQGQIFVILNAEESPHLNNLSEVDFIFRTGWGEMRHYYLDLNDQEETADKYLKIVHGILKECPEARPESLSIYIYEGFQNQELINASRNIRGVLSGIKRGRTKPEDGNPPEKGGGRRRLDLYTRAP